MTRPRPLQDAPRTPLVFKGLTVPYVAAWSAEANDESAAATLTLRTDLDGGNPRLVYTDEQPADRDRYGVLWHRVAWAPGRGRALFSEIHTLRQRTTMGRGLCQVCSRPGQVWMVSLGLWQAHADEHGPDAPYTTNDPAVCRACALSAARQCPHLSGAGYVFLAPRTWANSAVRGQVADPATGLFSLPRTIALPGTIPPPDPAILPLTLAKGLLSTLSTCVCTGTCATCRAWARAATTPLPPRALPEPHPGLTPRAGERPRRTDAPTTPSFEPQEHPR